MKESTPSVPQAKILSPLSSSVEPINPNDNFICSSCSKSMLSKAEELIKINDDLKEDISEVNKFSAHIRHLLVLLEPKSVGDQMNRLENLLNDLQSLKEDNAAFASSVSQQLETLSKKVDSLTESVNTKAQLPAEPNPSCESVDSLCKKIDNLSTLVNQSVSTPEVPVISVAEADKELSVEVPDPFSHHEENVVDETLFDDLLSLCKKSTYDQEGGHDVVSFGEKYSYSHSSSKRQTPPAFPDEINQLMKIVCTKSPNSSEVPSSASINRYTGSNCYLPEHSDDESCLDPTSSIYTFSLGSPGVIKYKAIHSGVERELRIKSNSLYVMTKQSQAFWTHRMDKPTEDEDDDYERFCITLRTVHHRFTKSTIIMGDSNTKYLQFGKGNGTFGFNMPGCRIYTPKLEDINPVQCAGYSNIVIHCGINNLKYHTSPSVCFGIMKDKLADIQQISPKSKVIVSPILPTKSAYFNQKALSFNKCLFDYVYNLAGVQTLKFSVFCNDQGFLHESLGRYLNHNDFIHLGKVGYILLANIIKDCVISNRVDGRPYANVSSMNRMNSGRMHGEKSRVGLQSRRVVNGGKRLGNVSMMDTTTTSNGTLLAPSQQLQA